MLEVVEYEHFNFAVTKTERNLRSMLGMYSALGVDVQAKVSAQVFEWYENPGFFGSAS